MRGILWANLSLWTGVVLTTRRVLPLRCTRRARYVGRWHRHTRLGFIAERRVLPLRRIRRTRHLRTWCQSPTRLGFRPRRFVLWSILTRGTRVGRVWWTYAVLRNPVRCSGVAGRYDAVPTEFRRLRSGSDWRSPLIHGCEQFAVRASSVLMLHLFRGWRHVPLADRCFLFGSRARRCSAGTAVIADAIYRGRVVDHGCAVNVVNVGDVHIVDGLVVVELPSSPIAAIVTATGIPVAIGNATVEADDRTPVAWHPNIAFGRAKGLLVNRKCRWTEVDRHEDLRKRSARYGQHHQCEQQRTNRAHDMHLTPLLPDHPWLGRRLLCLPHRLRRSLPAQSVRA